MVPRESTCHIRSLCRQAGFSAVKAVFVASYNFALHCYTFPRAEEVTELFPYNILYKYCGCGNILNWFTERSVKGRKSNLVPRGAVQCRKKDLFLVRSGWVLCTMTVPKYCHCSLNVKSITLVHLPKYCHCKRYDATISLNDIHVTGKSLLKYL